MTSGVTVVSITAAHFTLLFRLRRLCLSLLDFNLYSHEIITTTQSGTTGYTDGHISGINS